MVPGIEAIGTSPFVGNTAQIRRDGKAGEGEAMIRKA
jgi:hypothetical protein